MKYLLPILAVVLFVSSVSQAQHTGHPRLFFTASEIPGIVNRINDPASASSQLYGDVVAQSNWFIAPSHYLWHTEDSHNKGAYYHCLMSLAFRYLVEKQNNSSTAAQWSVRVKSLIFNPTPDHITHPNWFIEQGIIYDDWTGKNFGERARAQRVIFLSILYDWLYDQLDATQRGQIQQKIIDDDAFTYTWINYNAGIRATFGREDIHRLRVEHGTLALLLGAMSTYGENSNYPTSQADQDIAIALNNQYTGALSQMNRYFSPYDGAELDGISYELWLLYESVSILEAWRQWDGVNHWNDQGIQDRFSKIGDWLAYQVLPDPHADGCMFNTLNDSYSMHFSPLGMLLVLSAKYPAKAGLNQWVFNHTIQNIPNLLYNVSDENAQQEINGNSLGFILPILSGYAAGGPITAVEPSTVLPSSKDQLWNGEVDIRTSQYWGDANDIQFAFTSEPAIHPQFNAWTHHHSQADKNHFTLSAFGDLYLRSYGYDGQASVYHNIVLITNASGVKQGEAEELGSGKFTQGHIVQHASSAQFDFIDGDATDAYNKLYWGLGQPTDSFTVTSPGTVPTSAFNTVQWAHRYVSFSRSADNIPAYFIIADDIQKDGSPHLYTWRFHSAKTRSVPGTNTVRLAGTNGYLDMYFASTSSLVDGTTACPLDKSGVRDLCTTQYTICDSPFATDKTTAPVADPYFHVALVPIKSGSGNATPTYATMPITNGSIVSLTWTNNYTNYSILKYQNNLQTSGQGFVTDAKLSRVRVVTSSSTVYSFLLAEGTTLSYSGQELVNLYGQQGTVMKSGSTVDVVGSGSTYFRVYAPNATSVKLNGTNVSFVQIGDYVESNTVSINRTWSGNISTQYDVSVSATLTLSAGSTFKFGSGKQLTIYGTLSAIGTATQPIVFTSSNPNPARGDWYALALRNGTNTLKYCTVKYATYGIFVNDTVSNTIEDCTMQNCSRYGMTVYNTSPVGTGAGMTTLRNCTITGDSGGVSVTNGILLLDNSTCVSNNGWGVVLWTGATFYANTSYMTNNGYYGVFVNGQTAYAYLSEGYLPGYNYVTGNLQGQVKVISGGAYLGEKKTYTECVCGGDPYLYTPPKGGLGLSQLSNCLDPCYWQTTVVEQGGYNHISGPCYWVWNSASTTPLKAQLNYWGTCPPTTTPFYGTLDYSNWKCDEGSNATAMARGDSPEGVTESGANSGLSVQSVSDQPPDDVVYMRWILNLKAQVDDQTEEAEDALRLLATMVGPRGRFPDGLGRPWEAYLARVLAGTPSQDLRSLVMAYQLQAKFDRGNYNAAIEHANHVLEGSPSDELWLHANTIAVYAHAAKGDFTSAEATYNSTRSRGNFINSRTISHLRECLDLSARTGSIVPGMSSPDEETPQMHDSPSSTSKSFMLLDNYPNPFNPTTVISYTLPENEHVTIKVYNMLGQEMQRLVDAVETSGDKSVTFDGGNMPSGVYYCRLEAGRYSSVKKLLLVK